jgi:light-regulated signal transduction histidine kinase (bacteriophytochrome)
MEMARKPSRKELVGKLGASKKGTPSVEGSGDQVHRLVAELEKRNQELKQVLFVGIQDLQEPLENVTRYLRFVEARYKGRLDSDANEFIAEAVDGVNRMRQIITDLLACFSNEDGFFNHSN